MRPFDSDPSIRWYRSSWSPLGSFRGSLWERIKSSFRGLPKVVRILIWTQGIAYLLLLMLGDSAEARFVNESLAFNPSALLSGHVWTLFTSLLFHAADEPLVVLFDIAVLWSLGGIFGHRWRQSHFLFFYIAGGVGGAFLHLLLFLLFPDRFASRVLGASGCSFALFTAFWLIFGESPVSVFGSPPFKGKYLFYTFLGLETLSFFAGMNLHFPAEIGGVATGWLLVTGRWRPAKAARYLASLTGSLSHGRRKHGRQRFRVIH